MLQDQEASLHGLLVVEAVVELLVPHNLLVVMVVVDKVLIKIIPMQHHKNH